MAPQVRAPERAAKYRKRNARMRAWVQANPGRAAYIDYEVTTCALSPQLSHTLDQCVLIGEQLTGLIWHVASADAVPDARRAAHHRQRQALPVLHHVAAQR